MGLYHTKYTFLGYFCHKWASDGPLASANACLNGPGRSGGLFQFPLHRASESVSASAQVDFEHSFAVDGWSQAISHGHNLSTLV